jgi:hypothetical protein
MQVLQDGPTELLGASDSYQPEPTEDNKEIFKFFRGILPGWVWLIKQPDKLCK